MDESPTGVTRSIEAVHSDQRCTSAKIAQTSDIGASTSILLFVFMYQMVHQFTEVGKPSACPRDCPNVPAIDRGVTHHLRHDDLEPVGWRLLRAVGRHPSRPVRRDDRLEPR